MLCEASVSVTERGGRTTAVVHVVGELDLGSLPGFRSVLRSAVASEPDELVVDLLDCDFMDSAGLGVILGLDRRRPNGSWHLLAQGHPAELIVDLGLADRVGLRADRVSNESP